MEPQWINTHDKDENIYIDEGKVCCGAFRCRVNSDSGVRNRELLCHTEVT